MPLIHAIQRVGSGISIFYYPPPLRGPSKPVPGRARSPRPPLSKFGVCIRSLANDTLRCRVRLAWRRMALARAGASRGKRLTTEVLLKIRRETTTDYVRVLSIVSVMVVMMMMSKWIFQNMFVTSYNIPKTQLRLPNSSWPPAASRWFHALPTQQPYDLPVKERAPMNDSASGGLPGKVCSLPVSLQLVLYHHQRICCCCCTLLYCRRWMVDCVRASGCSTCFVLVVSWTHDHFTALSRPLLLYTSFAVLL